MNKGIFVTGTDTSVGKTVIAAALALVLRERGMHVGVMKPIASGCRLIGNRLVSEDAVFLMEAAENQYPALTNPIRLKEPLAPMVAAEIEENKIDLEKIFSAYQKLQKEYDYIIVEGIGGVLVPILSNYFVIDLIRELKLPSLVIGRIGLGTINHTLLTLEALKQRKMPIKGFILNGLEKDSNSIAELTNPRVLEKASKQQFLGVFPKIEKVDFANIYLSSLKDTFKQCIDVDALLA